MINIFKELGVFAMRKAIKNNITTYVVELSEVEMEKVRLMVGEKIESGDDELMELQKDLADLVNKPS